MIGGKKMHFEGPDHFSRALLTHGKSDNDLMHTIDLLLSQKVKTNKRSYLNPHCLQKVHFNVMGGGL